MVNIRLWSNATYNDVLVRRHAPCGGCVIFSTVSDIVSSEHFVFVWWDVRKFLFQIVEDTRWKKGAKERHRDGDEIKKEHLFITYPLMRLTFWLHEPTSKAVFKVLGPLLLVVTLMWVRDPKS